MSKRELLVAYFLGAATIFEPERMQERIMWAKTRIVSRMFASFLSNETTLSFDERAALLTEIGHNLNGLNVIHRYEIIHCYSFFPFLISKHIFEHIRLNVFMFFSITYGTVPMD